IVVALRRAKTTGLERLTLGLSLWVVLQAGGLAYVRGAGGAEPATRYFDILSFGFIVNFVALVALLDGARAGALAKPLARAALVGWLVFAVVGVDRLTTRSLLNLDAWRQFFQAHTRNVRQFLVSGEAGELTAKRPLVDLPYPDANRLATLLQD